MELSEILSVALAAIRANKLRSTLTMLGIVIGVAAVIAMVAVGTGASRAVEDRIRALGTDQLVIFPGASNRRGWRAPGETRVTLTLDDYHALRDARLPAIEAVVPRLSQNMLIKYGRRTARVSVNGSVMEYVPLNSYTVVSGRNLQRRDNLERRRVAVLGAGVPELFGVNGAAMVGQTIWLGRDRYEVVGLLSAKGAQGFRNADEQVVIPLESARYRTFGTDRLSNLTVAVTAPDSVNAAMLQVEGVLRREHGIRPGEENDFRIRQRGQYLDALQETSQTFAFLLGSVAGVSLLVGGIGIMNIMLVSVTERTREIGTRKALGATRRSILLQFLFEAVVLCALGGVLGILVGAGGAMAMARLANWNTLISPVSVAVAFLFSAAVGILFGLWPARRAARLDPIEALRYE